jgi:hypothetical protein
MKRIYFLLCAGIMASALAAACGDDDDDGGSSGKAGAAGKAGGGSAGGGSAGAAGAAGAGAAGAGASGAASAGASGAGSSGAAGGQTTTVVYDDFSDGSTYAARWASAEAVGIGEPEAIKTRAFDGGRLYLEATPFTTSSDTFIDHIKYFADSTTTFAIPSKGSVRVSGDIQVETPGAVAGHVLPTTGRVLLEGQQASATLHLMNTHETGLIVDWLVSQNKALVFYERVVPPQGGGCDLNTMFSQIVKEIDITPGAHNYAIRYSRNVTDDQPDTLEWFYDGQLIETVHQAGIPLDKQDPVKYADVIYPSQGPGQLIESAMTNFKVAHGIFTLLDEFPFNQCPGGVSIPAAERVFGQGAKAFYDNITVQTVTE